MRVDLKRFAADVKRIREGRGVSMRTLGLRLGVAPATVCRAESGERAPNIYTFLALCRWTGLAPLAYLDE